MRTFIRDTCVFSHPGVKEINSETRIGALSEFSLIFTPCSVLGTKSRITIDDLQRYFMFL